MPKLAVHVIVIVPQPEEMVTEETPFELGVTVSGAVPVNVNDTGAIAPLVVTVWLPPAVIEMVGGEGGTMVTVVIPEEICA